MPTRQHQEMWTSTAARRDTVGGLISTLTTPERLAQQTSPARRRIRADGGPPDFSSPSLAPFPKIVDKVPGERAKFESLGGAILITSGMAVVSMWFALTAAMGINGFAAVLPSLFWGVVIMGLDRWLITSMPIDNTRRKLSIAIPRFALAILLGSLISTPLVLRIFQPEINAEISVIKQQQETAYLTDAQRSQSARQVNYWQNQVSELERTINSKGQVPINPSTDPQLQSLNTRRAQEITLEQKYYQQWQCELDGIQGQGCGGSSGLAGNGSRAHALQVSYDQAAAQVADLTHEIQNREAQLTGTGGEAAKARLQGAEDAIPVAKAQLFNAQARLDMLLEAFRTQTAAGNGLIIRLEALNRLSSHDSTLEAARFLLFLLFLLIECLPVTVKLLQRPGIYETILARKIDMHVKITLMQEEFQRKRLAVEEEIQRKRLAAEKEEHLPSIPRPQGTMPAQGSNDREPLVVPDNLKREIENIYPFMDETSDMTAPEYREELENCFREISKGVNELLRRGYDNDQITDALRIVGDMVTRQLAAARQAALEKELSS